MNLIKTVAQALANEQMMDGSDYSEHELEVYGYMDMARTVLNAIALTHRIVGKDDQQLEFPFRSAADIGVLLP